MATLGEIAEANTIDREAEQRRKAVKREADRARIQRKRDQNREKARILAIAEAERMAREAARQEIEDEMRAPAVLRRAIVAPDGTMLRGPRVEVIAGRPAHVDPVISLKLSNRERRAAHQLQTDWREVGAGLSIGSGGWLRVSGGSGDQPIIGKDGAMLAQIEARKRLDGALAHVGSFAPCLARVVLDCVPVAVWAVEANLTMVNATAWIGAGLELLSRFYWPPREDGASRERILTIGPSRDSYDMSVEPELTS